MTNPVKSDELRPWLDEEHLAHPGAAGAAVVPLLSGYLEGVAVRTQAQLGDVAGVAITLKVDDEPFTAGASNALAAEVDAVQFEVGIGPCLHALRTGVRVHVPDLGQDYRWGTYGPKAAARGACCCISEPVLVDGEPAAVLKAYSGVVDGIDEEQRRIVRSVAQDVAGGVALARYLSAQAHELDDRESAMDTRRAIDLALGVLMERTGCSADDAFTLLRQQSQATNTKLRDVARQVLATLPGAGRDDTKSPFRQPGSRLT